MKKIFVITAHAESTGGRAKAGGTQGGNIIQKAGRAVAGAARKVINRIRGGNTGTGGRTRG